MTFAACEIDTDPAGDAEVVVCEPLTFDSLPAVALDGVTEGFVGGTSDAAEFGGTSAADGGTDPTDAGSDAEVAADGDAGACTAGLCATEVEVEDADGASEAGGAATRGAFVSTGVCVSTLVTGGFTAAVGDAGATGVTTGAVVVCTTGGACGSTACCV